MTTMRWNSVEARAEVASRVVDVHHHLGPKGRITGEDGKVDVASALPPHLEIMDRHGVDQAFLIASHHSVGRGADGSGRVEDIIAGGGRRGAGRFPIRL